MERVTDDVLREIVSSILTRAGGAPLSDDQWSGYLERRKQYEAAGVGVMVATHRHGANCGACDWALCPPFNSWDQRSRHTIRVVCPACGAVNDARWVTPALS